MDLAYTDEGTGPVVLAIHGCPGSVRDWRWLGHPLASHFRLIRLDLPGFGETPLGHSPRGFHGGPRRCSDPDHGCSKY